MLIIIFTFCSCKAVLASNEKTVTAILTIKVTTTVKPSEQFRFFNKFYSFKQ